MLWPLAAAREAWAKAGMAVWGTAGVGRAVASVGEAAAGQEVVASAEAVGGAGAAQSPEACACAWPGTEDSARHKGRWRQGVANSVQCR